MQRRITPCFYMALATGIVLLAVASATERSTGELRFYRSLIKTVTAPAPPEVVTVPTCTNRIALFNPMEFTCPVAVCTIEATVTAEVSDITPGADSIRFYLTVDGTATGVLPSTNIGVHSTAKAGQIESATASWMHNAIAVDDHLLEVHACVADTTNDGDATAFVGDRILIVRIYKGN